MLKFGDHGDVSGTHPRSQRSNPCPGHPPPYLAGFIFKKIQNDQNGMVRMDPHCGNLGAILAAHASHSILVILAILAILLVRARHSGHSGHAGVPFWTF